MINFTPGPSQLYFTVADHIKNALRANIPSLSHRSKEFEAIYKEVTKGLKELLELPHGFHIFFTSSATEIWERSIENLVEHSSCHFVNGAFSKRYAEIASQLKKKVHIHEAQEGLGFESVISIPAEVELIAITHNETSTGVSWPTEAIAALKSKNPDALVIVDAVSSLPYPAFDYTQLDAVFFSVQKAFGLPAGLGVWIVNEKCLAKAEMLATRGVAIGTYHNLPTLHAFAAKNQTPETPNVLGIYLLSKIVQDFLRRGVNALRKETEYKAAILYQALDNHPVLNAFVNNQEHRSKTVVVADTGSHTNSVTNHLIAKGLHPGDGYGKSKANQLRFANFPAHSKEQFELLVDTLELYKG